VAGAVPLGLCTRLDGPHRNLVYPGRSVHMGTYRRAYRWPGSLKAKLALVESAYCFPASVADQLLVPNDFKLYRDIYRSCLPSRVCADSRVRDLLWSTAGC
jgi:hypothetical protein